MVGTNFGVNRETIAYAEGCMGFYFPEQLRQYYLDVGYGNLLTGSRILSPEEVVDFRFRQGEFAKRPRKYDRYSSDRLYFLMEADKAYSIGEDGIYYKNRRVARNIYDFLTWVGG